MLKEAYSAGIREIEQLIEAEISQYSQFRHLVEIACPCLCELLSLIRLRQVGLMSKWLKSKRLVLHMIGCVTQWVLNCLLGALIINVIRTISEKVCKDLPIQMSDLVFSPVITLIEVIFQLLYQSKAWTLSYLADFPPN